MTSGHAKIGTLTSSHWGTYRVHAENGSITALEGFERDEDPSPIGQGIVDVLDGPTRIKKPMVRRGWLEHGPGNTEGARGADEFVEVSWSKAIKLVAEELNRVRDRYGNRAIYGGSYGWSSAGRFHHAQSQLKRFLNSVGGYTYSLNTYSYAAAEVTLPHVLGDFYSMVNGATSWDVIKEHSSLFVAFGGAPAKNGQVTNGGVGRHVQKQGMLDAASNGVKVVNVSPLRSDVLDEMGADWIPVYPGSDVALLLGIAHTLHTEKLADTEFLSTYTVGYERFRQYFMGETDGVVKDCSWAELKTGIPAARIRDLARDMARQRTMISVSWSLTRQDNGEQPYWAAIAVASMLGQLGLPGGGIGFGYSAMNAIGANYEGIPGASLPQGKNPIKSFIPVARVTDLLLNPGKQFEYNGMTGTYPEIKLVYWAGGNPFHHHQDLVRMRKAWQKPDTVIVHEWCWNAQAKHADIVLPAATFLERNDIASSSRDPFLVYMQKAAEPVGQSLTDYEIFSALAEELGAREAFTEGRDEEQWLQVIYDETRQKAGARGINLPTFEEFKAKGWFENEMPKEPQVLMKAFRENPEANALGTPSGKIEIFSETVAGFGYEECPGFPFWNDPKEWLGQKASEYPLHLVSNQPKNKLHSQLDHGSHSRKSKINGREPVVIHPDDAKARNIVDGSLVRLFNGRGACLCSAVVSDEVRPRVLQLSTGAWFDPPQLASSEVSCRHGNPNVLTRDEGTSRLAQGPSALSCLVEIELFSGEASDMQMGAFSPPVIRSEPVVGS
ncbi:molybdopterin guanine dinucleotide-containing S/N-oxide reductase [Marinobacter xiaoshiensis]|uniref:Molybdopterin guanine dinucleotide-containing S/N-oxide reductase n=1 Tax=Marinobacter xiaoshiensis TaxID=3073652 RepID=A0ABU2HF60_9GAMM|nr:molybdopterin guanine dinucleotide-containing S/N-oxide reductase [Marinobacter sp. F60267]MDS1309715.1 molybdopterin guanine dinucleotide-containing S/N-oxide reductase [Marinobacter sp. F60267]